MLGDNFSWMPCVFVPFMNWDTYCFYFKLYFQRYLYSKQPWHIKLVSFSIGKRRFIYCPEYQRWCFQQEQRVGMLTACYKRSRFPKFTVSLLQCNTLLKAGIIWPSLYHLVRARVWGTDAISDTSIAKRNKVICLWSRSLMSSANIKFWQETVSACNRVESETLCVQIVIVFFFFNLQMCNYFDLWAHIHLGIYFFS